MGRFDGVLLASDFDNTLIYTEDALRSGAPVPQISTETLSPFLQMPYFS